MTPAAGNVQAYANALLERICEDWGQSRRALRASPGSGRSRGDDLVRQTVIATFIRQIEPLMLGRIGQHRHHQQRLTAAQLASLIGVSIRSANRYRRLVQDHITFAERRRAAHLAVANCKHNVSEHHVQLGRLHNQGMLDRASLEEQVEGGRTWRHVACP